MSPFGPISRRERYAFSELYLRLHFLVDPFRQKNLHQRLIGHIPLVGQHLERIDHRLGKPDRYTLDRRFQMRESHFLRPGPVDEFRGIVVRPEIPFFIFRLEFWQ